MYKQKCKTTVSICCWGRSKRTTLVFLDTNNLFLTTQTPSTTTTTTISALTPTQPITPTTPPSTTTNLRVTSLHSLHLLFPSMWTLQNTIAITSPSTITNHHLCCPFSWVPSTTLLEADVNWPMKVGDQLIFCQGDENGLDMETGEDCYDWSS